MSDIPTISETELELLKLLWEHGPATARELRAAAGDEGRTWAHTTILTLLTRLEDKGCVAVDRGASRHVFEAAVDRDVLLSSRLAEMADDLCDGSVTPLMQALVKGRPFSEDEIAEFRQLLDGLAKKPRRKR